MSSLLMHVKLNLNWNKAKDKICARFDVLNAVTNEYYLLPLLWNDVYTTDVLEVIAACISGMYPWG